LLFPDPEQLGVLAALAPEAHGEADDLSRQFSEIVSSIRIGDTWKLTSPGRLHASTCALGRRLPEQPALRFLDVGGSDGINTLETVRHLQETRGNRVEATLLDLYVAIHRYGSRWIREYRMSDGSPVLVRVGPVGVQLSGLHNSRDPVARWLGRRYLAGERRRRALPCSATFSLVNPLVARDGRIRVHEADALLRQESLVRGFDAVRASNFLNRDYFTLPQIETVLSHLHAYLRPNGLLVVSRSHVETDGLEHGSIWTRESHRFRRIEDFAGESYIADVVDRFSVGG
jgi:hypothetical protein